MVKLNEVQQQAFEEVVKHILIGRLANIPTRDRQTAVFNRLHKKDALIVAEAVLEKLFPGTLEAVGGVNRG
jgi:hypothetical protein